MITTTASMADLIREGLIKKSEIEGVNRVYFTTDDSFPVVFKLGTAEEVEAQHACDWSDHVPTVVIDGTSSHPTYFAMERVNGLDLHDVMRRIWSGYNLTLPQIIQIALDGAYGIRDIGKSGVVHCDIKEENLFVPKDGLVKIGDFGISKRVGSTANCGTPGYQAPEQIITGDTLDSRTDIHGWGIVVYELAVGELAIHQSSDIQKQTMTLQNGRPTITDQRIPEKFAEIIERAFKRNKDERYQNPNDLIEDLVAVRDKYGSRERIPNY